MLNRLKYLKHVLVFSDPEAETLPSSPGRLEISNNYYQDTRVSIIEKKLLFKPFVTLAALT